MEERWSGRPILSGTADRIREPCELTARSAGATGPTAITPVDAGGAQGPMMLASARGTTRTDLRDVNLVDLVVFTSTVTREQAGQARHEAGTDHDRNTVVAGLVIEGEQPADL